MKSGRKNSFTDLNNMHKHALFKVAHFQTNEKNSAGKEKQSFSFARKSEIDHFCRKMTTFAEKIESLVPLRYSNDR